MDDPIKRLLDEKRGIEERLLQAKIADDQENIDRYRRELDAKQREIDRQVDAKSKTQEQATKNGREERKLGESEFQFFESREKQRVQFRENAHKTGLTHPDKAATWEESAKVVEKEMLRHPAFDEWTKQRHERERQKRIEERDEF